MAPSLRSRSKAGVRRARARVVLVGVDTGGTFTDFVCFDGGALRVHKRPSTPADPARAVLDGLRELLGPMRTGVCLTYGSTVATNAVLERKGAQVALLATAGFEDVVEIGRQTRPDLYALEPAKPAPLVDRRACIGVAERLDARGRVLVPLAARALRAAVAAVRRRRVESIAVCLLHAYANSVHERRLGRALRGLGVPVSLSHQLVAEYREYERASTTLMNAYVAPVMGRHLAALRRGVGGATLRVMQSNGGAISAATASREAVRTLLSGPAAGAIGALAAARRIGTERIIGFDMGGTSTDVTLIDGAVRLETQWRIAELPVQVPAIDIHTVGAGGGSLAYRDAGGALKVGPESAGADPGPACYGRGDRPTVTDADLLLGRLVPAAFLGGRMALDVPRARAALARLARTLGLGAEEAAEGVVRVVNAGMERAIRRISVERGHDPRDYTLVAFGGAAGMHACELAAALGIRRVLVPLHPGLLSAWGATSADVQRDCVQTVRLVDPSSRELSRRLRVIEQRARRDLRAERILIPPFEKGGPGRIFSSAPIHLASFLDARYRGQSYELRIPMQRDYRAAFHAAHRALYGYADPERAIEVVNLRVIARAPGPALPRVRIARAAAPSRPHRVRWNGRWLRARHWDRDALPRARRLAGPLVITELSATSFVPPGWSARVAPSGDLVLERSRR